MIIFRYDHGVAEKFLEYFASSLSLLLGVRVTECHFNFLECFDLK